MASKACQIVINTDSNNTRSQQQTLGLQQFVLELCAAAADRMSASHRRRFRDVFTSCCTPAICC